MWERDQDTVEPVGDEEAAFGKARRRRLWMVLFAAVATSLWVQWLGPGVWAELRSADGSEAVLALQMMPVLVGVLALVWRHPAAVLVLYPVSFLPGLAMLPEAEWEALARPGALTLSLATFGLYLIVAAVAPRRRPTQAVARRSLGAGGDPDGHADAFRRFVVTRFVATAALFAVITYALFFAPSTAEALAAIDGEQARRTQHVFTVIAMYFGWMIAVYVGAILPMMNWEHHRRSSALPGGQRQLLRDPQRLARRVFIWLVGLMVMTFSFVFLLS